MVFANVFGSIINDLLPSGVILTVLMILIFLGILINIYNAVKRYKSETIKIKENDQKLARQKYKTSKSELVSLREIPEQNSDESVKDFYIKLILGNKQRTNYEHNS